MNPLMANGHGMGWPRSVQVLVQIVWTLNPTLMSFSGCDQSLVVSPCDWLRIGFSCRCPPSARLYMDVFVAVCFYPPDLFPPLVMAPVYYEIKEWNILVYVLPSSLVWSSMWLLLYSLFMSAPVLHISSAYGQSMKPCTAGAGTRRRRRGSCKDWPPRARDGARVHWATDALMHRVACMILSGCIFK